MKTCKDCIHVKVCDDLIAYGLPWEDGKYPADEWCDRFKNKADFVEVCRCRDCKYWVEEKDFGMFCSHWGSTLAESQADDFCSYGERSDTK